MDMKVQRLDAKDLGYKFINISAIIEYYGGNFQM